MTARWFRRFVNIYPPFVGAGVSVTHIAEDWRHVRVEMPLRWYNRNYVGTHFGGSLFAMTDPFFMIMVMQNLGTDYLVWDKAAEIDYVAPGRKKVHAEFTIADEVLDEIRRETAGGDKFLRWCEVTVYDEDGATVAKVRKLLYVRKRKTGGTGD